MKKFYKSKTIWANLLFTLIYGIEQFVGSGHLNPEQAVFIITLINLALRFVTKEPIEV
jgi:hypothetical protein